MASAVLVPMCSAEPVLLLSVLVVFCFFFNDTATTEIYTLSLHDALPIYFGWFAGSRRGLLPGESGSRRGGASPCIAWKRGRSPVPPDSANFHAPACSER